jgi:hypothetical protein
MKKLLLASLLLVSLSLFGVNVSTTTVSAQSITVNTATSHGFSAANGGQGVCVSYLPACGVVTSTPTSTQFVLLVAGTTPSACASACGSATAAPQVIVLSTNSSQQGFVTYTWLNWITTQQPCPGPSTSSWVSANGSAGATTPQRSAIQNGLFIEHLRNLTVSSSTAITTVELLIQNDYASDQAAATLPCQFYGFTWDPTSATWAKQ